MKTGYLFITLCLVSLNGFAQKVKSDLERENLKGQVDSLITDVTGKYQLNGVKKQRHISKLIEKFNRQGNLIYSVYYSSYMLNDTSGIKIAYEYNSKQQLIRKTKYYSNGTPEEKSIYTYRAETNEAEERRYSWHDNKLLEIARFKYDGSGNVIQQVNYDKDWKETRKVNYLYSKGNLVTEEGKFTDWPLNVTTMAYDALDNPISIIKTNGTGKESKIYHYFNYDKQFNWLSMDEPGDPDHITQRTITYYK